MTVIAYRNGVLACDSILCKEDTGEHVTEECKVMRLPSGALLGVAGDADSRAGIELLSGVSTVKALPKIRALRRIEQEFEGLLVLPRGQVFYILVTHEQPKGWTSSLYEMTFPDRSAIGSGAPYAIGAMMQGAGAIKAVKIACAASRFCGLPIHSVRLAR